MCGNAIGVPLSLMAQSRTTGGTLGPVETLQGILPDSLLCPEELPGIASARPQLCSFLMPPACTGACMYLSKTGIPAAPHVSSKSSRTMTKEWQNGPDHHLKNKIPSVALRPASLFSPLLQHPHQQLFSHGWAQRSHFNATLPLLCLSGRRQTQDRRDRKWLLDM